MDNWIMQRRSFLFGGIAATGTCLLPGSAAQKPLGTIAFVQNQGLWIRELPNGRSYSLVSDTQVKSPRYSPSGKWIAYLRHDVLHVVSSIDGRSIQVGKRDRGNAAPRGQWSPVHDELWVEGSARLDVFSSDDGWRHATRRIVGASLPVVFNCDGQEILYGDTLLSGRGPAGEPMRTGRLCRLALHPRDAKPIVLGSSYLSGRIPYSWCCSDKHVIFWEDPDFSSSVLADGLELFSIPSGGGSPQSLGVSTLVHNDMLSLSPTRNRLAVSAGGGRNEWEEKRIAVIDLESAVISHLTEKSMTAVCPAWSPDGTAIAYSTAPGPSPGSAIGGGDEARRLLAKRRIWVTDVGGANATRTLTSDARYRDEAPMWSADGKHILFCRIANDNSKSLWLMGADGTDAVQLAGPLYLDPGTLGADNSWFGYYGYIEWRNTFDWIRGR